MTLATLLLASLPVAASEPPLPPGDHVRRVALGPQTRSYLVHVPPRYDPATPTPVVLAFHSAAMNGQGMAGFCGLSDKADASGFVVVYPNGTGATPLLLYWDAGGVRGRPADDVGFVATLLDDLATVVNVDASRVYATGMSNGGMLCYRLAAELSDRIAAIAPVAGTMALEACHPTRPVPVLHFHGTADRLVLFDGPDERIPKNLKFLSVADSVRMWAKADGCPETPAVSRLPDRCDDGTVVRKEVFGPGRDGSEVVLYAIEGGGHTWPGKKPRVSLLGKSTKDVSANDLIWDFFQKHPMKRATATTPPAAVGVRASTDTATLRAP